MAEAKKPAETEKKTINYEKFRKVLIEKYGLWLADHYFRKHTSLTDSSSIKDLEDKKLFDLAIEDNFRTMNQPFLEKLISSQLEKIKEVGIGSPCITIKGLMLLQIFSVRDISAPSHSQDLVTVSKKQGRVLLLNLFDGSTKINAVEVEHIPLFDNQQLLPGMKIQLKNAQIRERIILLGPDHVLWCGGEYKPLSEKFLKFRESKQADTRIFNKHIGKNETPPPPFEVLDLQSRGKQSRFGKKDIKKKAPKSLGVREDQQRPDSQTNQQQQSEEIQQPNEGEDQYDEYYDEIEMDEEGEYYDENENENENEEKQTASQSGYGQKKASDDYYYQENDEERYEGDDFAYKDLWRHEKHNVGDGNEEYYDEEGDEYYDDENEYYDEEEEYYEEDYEDNYEGDDYEPGDNYEQESKYEPASRYAKDKEQSSKSKSDVGPKYVPQKNQYQKEQKNQSDHHTFVPATSHQRKSKDSSQSQGKGYNQKSSNKRQSNIRNLVELSRPPHLPIQARLNCYLKNAILTFDPTTQIPWIRFEINDATANCQAMSSQRVFKWIYDKYADQNTQVDVNEFYSAMIYRFMNQWGQRNVTIEIELVSPTDIPVIHSIF